MTSYCFYDPKGHTHVLRTEGGPDVSRGFAHMSQYPMLRQLADSRTKLEVCSVNWIKKSQPKEGSDLLELLSKLEAPASTGGWRSAEQDLVCLEVASFNPLTSILGIDKGLNSKVFSQHPAIREGFLFPFPDGIPLCAMSVLRLVYDLRRFADPDHARKRFFLRDHFKLLTPQRFFRIFQSEDGSVDSTDVPLKIMLDAWYEQPLNTTDPESKKAKSGRAFLFRKYRDVVNEMTKNHSEEKALAYGLWKTTAMFCDFLQMTWQAGLGDKEFDPARFFDDEKTTEEFYTFIKRIDKGLDISKPQDKESLD